MSRILEEEFYYREPIGKFSLVNKNFNYLKVIKYFGTRKKTSQIFWICRCVCGKDYITHTSVLKSNRIKSCGCQRYKNADKSCMWKGVGQISGKFLSALKHKITKYNIESDLDSVFLWELYLKQNKRCAISGVYIFFGEKTNAERTASLDRIDSCKGYTKDNVQWVHKKINVAKMDLSQDEFIELCTIVASHNNILKKEENYEKDYSISIN